MKIKNVLFSLFVMVAMLFTITVKAATTEAPNTFKVNASDLYSLRGSELLGHGSTLHFAYKENADGKVVYCIEIHEDMVSYGSETYTLLKGKELDARYAYIMENGYPNKSLTGNKNKDYFITGLAIWYLIDPNDYSFTNFNIAKGTYMGYDSDVARWINKLVTDSKSATYVNPSLKLSSSVNNLTLSSDGKYYVSSAIGVSATKVKGNYTVSLEGAPSGTIITDEKGNSKTSFATTNKFIVKVPVSSVKTTSLSFKVNASATGTVNKAYIYKAAVASNQDLTAVYPENHDLKDTATFNLEITTKTYISKQDITNKKELPGATLVVKDASGKEIDKWVSTTEQHLIEGLKPGKYTLTETVAPAGYELSTETITFEVKNDGSVTKVVMYNTPKTKLSISKQDITDKKELPGATLILKDASGKEIDKWVSTNEPHLIEGLKPGKYTLTEIIAPEGYKLSTETIEFELKADGTMKKVVMYNAPKDKVCISKQDSTTSEEVKGASLVLKDKSGNIIYAWVSSDTPYIIDDLKPGKYTLTETMAPEGYIRTEETIEFEYTKDGKLLVDGKEVDKIIMYNTPETIVEVPSTSSFKTITASLIGLLIIGLGSVIIYRNYKKNEEV